MTGPDRASAETGAAAAARFRPAAVRAARAFLAEDAALELLGHGQSVTWRADSARGRFVLRLHVPVTPAARPEFSTPRALESECAWLRALSDDTDLVVPRPEDGPHGTFVATVDGPDGDAIPCTLLGWVEGRTLAGRRSAAQAAALGELLAALHAHAQSWARPPGFERPEHTPAAWRAALVPVGDLVAAGVATADQRELLARAVDRCERELAPLARRPERVGLVHGDLHESNYVEHAGSVRPLDFGRCGTGPWLYDVAECLGHLAPARRRDLVAAYARRRPLADGDLRALEGYFVAALVELFGYHAPNPAEHEYLARAVPAWAPHVRRWVAGLPFLFEI